MGCVAITTAVKQALLQHIHKNRNINVSVLLQVVLVDVTCAAFVVFWAVCLFFVPSSSHI